MKINYNKIGKPRRYKYSKGGFIDKTFGLVGKLGETMSNWKNEGKAINFSNIEEVKDVLPKKAKEMLKKQYQPSKELESRILNTLEDSRKIDNLKEADMYDAFGVTDVPTKSTENLDLQSKIIARKLHENIDKREVKLIPEKGRLLDYKTTDAEGNPITKKVFGLAYPKEASKKIINSDENLVKKGVTPKTEVIVGLDPDLMSLQATLGVTIHELSHLLQRLSIDNTIDINTLKSLGIDIANPKHKKAIAELGALNNKQIIDSSGYRNIVDNIFGDIVILNPKKYKYPLSATEIHSRIQEIRYAINPDNPWKKVNKEELYNLIKSSSDVNDIKHLVEIVKESDKMPEFLNLINKYWVIGAGIGVTAGVAYGANQMGSNQQLRKGGKIVYKNNKSRSR